MADKSPAMTSTTSPRAPSHKKKWLLLSGIIFLILAIALGVGLGVGLTRHHHTKSGTATTTLIPATPNTTNSTEGSFWRPQAGESWQIILSGPVNDSSPTNVSIYDIDLFDNTPSVISSLQSKNISVICYFSAGSYEDWRSDASSFHLDDYGKELDGWPGEFWLNTNSSNVRNIMSTRLKLAKKKGCDGVDPDNIDGYDNDNGIGLSTWDAVDYLTWMAEEAHGLGLAIGLKNGGKVVGDVLDMLQWEVNEQCVQYGECEDFREFVERGKPVLHIEYPGDAPEVDAQERRDSCAGDGAEGFSTVLKEMDLSAWVEFC